ncbi:MAG: outer membrane protein assembly factor BamB family protein [Planctomycetota bacterium]|jgi:outer membrane protein assembly factor BamB
MAGFCLSSLALLAVISATALADGEAEDILKGTGVPGGLVVHVGCGDGKLTAALRANEGYLVHGLGTDPTNVDKAREQIRSLGPYGKVAVDRWDGKALPYSDNMVNLLIAEDPPGIPAGEIDRVLVPNGVAYLKKDGRWIKAVKPRPGAMDDWTHCLYDASGNAVSGDTVVGPPRHYQWAGSPKWSRHHDHLASVSAMASAGGRIFYIVDEGSPALIQLPPKWTLVARDAFNGVVLWKRPLELWQPHLWPMKSGPAQLPRRLVAIGDRVYVTLGLTAPLSVLDAATGQTLGTYPSTKATEEVVVSEGVLFALVDEEASGFAPFQPVHREAPLAKMHADKNWQWVPDTRAIVAIQLDSGMPLWKKHHTVVPLTLAADTRSVFLHDGQRIIRLDRTTGERVWQSEPMEVRPRITTDFGPTLVVYKDVVLFSGGTRQMAGVSAKDGTTLWTAPHPRSGYCSPEDLLVAGGLVWGAGIASTRDDGVFIGRDPATGEIKSQFPCDAETNWFPHQRCYRSKATERFLLPSRTGIEFVDFQAKHWDVNHWVRGGCLYGIMPANGMVYTPPHSCGCYMEAKLTGLCALGPEAAIPQLPDGASEENRLEHGPAYDTPMEDASSRPGDWPTFRHDPARSGFTKAQVTAELEPKWHAEVGGRLSTVVVAGGRLYVASIDNHTVHALDASSGKESWCFSAGGRVDSPPTIHRGRVLFGSADGWLYCLRADDGKLAWRFRGAPLDRRMMAYEQLESVWPLHGSVLVQDDVAFCVAGRSMFLDGGLRFLRVDVVTGRKLSETVLDERGPETGKDLHSKVFLVTMPQALPAILSSDNRYVFMGHQRFNLDGMRIQVNIAGLGAPEEDERGHLLAGTGFLDGSWLHRSHWVYDTTPFTGWAGWYRGGQRAPAGRILVFDDARVYGYARKPEYFAWTTPMEYHLFGTSHEPEVGGLPATAKAQAKKRWWRPDPLPTIGFTWSEEIPFHVRAMVQAGKTLFIAGPPDLIDEEAVFGRAETAANRALLADQAAAFEGRKGALLWAVSTTDGRRLAARSLDYFPVWDGMAAADGRLYMALTDGRVVCMGSPVERTLPGTP